MGTIDLRTKKPNLRMIGGTTTPTKPTKPTKPTTTSPSTESPTIDLTTNTFKEEFTQDRANFSEDHPKLAAFNRFLGSGVEEKPEGAVQELTAPFSIAGGVQLVKVGKATKVVKAMQTGKKGAAAGKIASNSKTLLQTQSWLTRLLTQNVVKTTTNAAGVSRTINVATTMSVKTAAVGAAVGMIVGGIGTYPFDQFILEEAIQTTMFPLTQAYREENPEAYAEARAAYDALLNQGFWDKVVEFVPYANVYKRLQDYKKAAAAAVSVYDKLMENQMAQVDAMGEKAQQDGDFLANTTIYNQKKIDLEIELTAIRAAGDVARLARAMEYERDLAKFEAEDREAIAEFWLDYAEAKRKVADNSRPSNLNFGIV